MLDRLHLGVLKACQHWFQSSVRAIEDARMRREVHRSGIGKLPRIPSWTQPAELRLLYRLAEACPPGAMALEVGSHLGASSFYLAAGLSKVNGHLLCVDTWWNDTMPEGRMDLFDDFLENVRSLTDRITPIRKRSDELDDPDVPRPLDLVFIDADHSYPAVRDDIHRVVPWMRVEALLSLHDFGAPEHPGVARAVGELLATGEWVVHAQVERMIVLRRPGTAHPSGLA
ncbi:MAG TPA: class I SAM-dependent methyltransferase [Thermoanaerobaculia bacterium]|nr:class I SAM-dependent methyltransferase [Thermoanaerobaculia bacterium]